MMRPRIALIAAALALAGAGCSLQPSLDQIVSRCITARGGLDAIHGMRTKRQIGRIVFAGRDSGAFMVEIERPGKMREELTLTGGRIIRTLNGTRGWIINTVRGDTQPETLSAGIVRNMTGGADLDGPLPDWKQKGYRVELLGSEPVRGREAWKLKITEPDSSVRYDFIDQATNLEVKWMFVLDQGGGQSMTFESYFSDYRPAGGVQHAYRIESGEAGRSLGQLLEFDRVDVNLPIDDADFGPPTIPAPPAPPKPAAKPARHSKPKHHSAPRHKH